MEDIIKVENVAKGYAKHQVLQNLDLNINYPAWTFRLRQNCPYPPYCRPRGSGCR